MLYIRLAILFVLLAPISGYTQNIQIVQDVAMDFSEVYPDPSGTVVKLKFNGQRTATGSTILSGSGRGAAFTVTGPKKTSVNISFSTNNNLSGAGIAMPLTDLSSSVGGATNLGGNGQRSFKVGGSLNVNANQKGGAYNGTYIVYVDLN